MTRWLDLPTEPWRNGGGLTRTVARDQAPEGERWRVSVAEITASSAFSCFPGMDRTAVLIAGGPLNLTVAGLLSRPMALVGDMARFDGEANTTAILHGAPARLWNVMARRDQARCEVAVIRQVEGQPLKTTTLIASADTVHVVLVLAGAVRCVPAADIACSHSDQAWPCTAGHLLVLREPGARHHLQPESDDSVLLHTSITCGPAHSAACG